MANFKNNTEKPSVLIQQLDVRPIRRQTQDIERWRAALKAAQADNKNRATLLELYDDILLDGYLESLIGKRVKAITNTELKFFDKKGQEVEEVNELTKKPFFEKLLKEIINSKFWGFSLIECEWDKKNTENSETYLIDRRHVKPEFGIVVKRPMDLKGINFNEAPYYGVVVRAGEKTDLGLLLKVCQYAIYKRGGFGDYAEFAEVFGMPFRHGKYSDPATRQVLDDAMREMGAAGYIITPNDAIIEHHYSDASGGSTLHNDFRKACNEEMTVSILGVTETTGSSSSSGYAQSKTHSDVEWELHEDDRLFVLRVLNTEVNRVLKNLGYTAEGEWKFVDSESIELATRIDIDLKVASKVPVADDYFYKKYGVPKPDNYDELKAEMQAKAEMPQMPSTVLADFHNFLTLRDSGNLFDKFKSFFFERQVDTQHFYDAQKECGCSGACEHTLELADTGSDIKNAFDAFISDVYSGKITRTMLHQGLYNSTAEQLIKAMSQGFGKVSTNYKEPDGLMLEHLRSNIYAFSGAKNFEQYTKTRDLLFNDKGELKPFNKFRDDVFENVNAKYNEQYLQAESQTAKASARGASNWGKYERDADLYPYLEYRTAGDNRVRREHARFDGYTAAITDPIWDRIYPPNGYRCRCSVRQRQAAPKNQTVVTSADINKEIPNKYFQTNPGKTKMVFDENAHPYFVNTSFKEVQLSAVKNYGLPTSAHKVAASKIEFKPRLNSIEMFNAKFKALANTVSDIVLTDKKGTKIIYNQKSHDHLLQDKQVAEFRYELFESALQTVESPDEVWSLHHFGKRGKSSTLTQRYVKFFKDGAMVVNVNEDNGIIRVTTFYSVSSLADDGYRVGVLIYKK